MTQYSPVHQDAHLVGAQRVWCPFCSARIPVTDGQAEVRCTSCAQPVVVAAAVAASDWWVHAWDQQQRANELHQQAAALHDSAVVAQTAADAARHRWQEASAAARSARLQQGSAAVLPGPAGREGSDARPLRQRSVPVAVLLQGTGAVLLLAALMVGSAVLWGSLPPGLQVAMLVAMVAGVGGLSVWASRRLPATSAVLAVLTAAAGIVVATATPQIIGALDVRWYPTAASAAGAATLLAAGRGWSVRLWWHAGLLVAGLTVALGVAATVSAIALQSGSVLWWVALVLLILPWPVAALLASRAAADNDPETAVTTRWIGVAALLAMLAALGGAGLAWLVALGEASLTPWDRAAAAAALGAASTVLWGLDREHGWAGAGGRVGTAVLGALPVVVLFPTSPVATAAALVAGLGSSAALACLALLGVRVPAARLAAVLAAVVLGGCVFAALAVAQGGRAWLIALLWGVGAAMVGLGVGLALRVAAWLPVAFLVFAATWAMAWGNGRLGDTPEALVLPIGLFALLIWALGRRRELLPKVLADRRTAQFAVLLMVVPTTVLVWQGQVSGGVPLWRVLLEFVAMCVVAVWAGLARSGWTIPVTGAAVALLGHAWVGLLQFPQAPLEAYSVVLALAVAGVLTAGVDDGWCTARRVLLVSAAVLAVPSWFVAMAGPVWNTELALRVLWCTLWLAVVLALVWRRPGWAWLVGTAAVVLPLWVWVVWLGGRWPMPWEVLSVPVAAAAACSAALAARGWGASGWVWAGRTGVWTLVTPSLVLVLVVLVPQTTTEALRLLALVVGLALIAVLTDRRSPADSLVAATLLVATAVLLALNAAAMAELPVEGYTVPLAVAVALVGGWIMRPADAVEWWRWARWPVLGVLGLSSAWAVTVGLLPSAAWYDAARVAALIGIWTLAAQRSWSRAPRAAAACGAVAVVVAAANAISLLVAGRTDPPLELVTWPLAAALGAISWLVWRAAGQRGPSLLWVGPTTALVLLPTSALAWADGTAGWRAWFGLLLGTVVLVAGVRRAWAGLVVPGLLSIVMVVLPVLLQVASDTPLWVPLTIGGAALITIGARLEASRREGRRLVDWAVHLR